MKNKVFISILVIIIVLMGGSGYYSYNLNRQLDRLDRKLTALAADQTTRIDSLSNEISDMRKETSNNFESLQEQLKNAESEISTLSENITAASSRITGIEDKITSISSNITDLAGRVENTEKNYANSTMNASSVFAGVSRVTVRITDGQNVIGSGFVYDAAGHIVTAYHVVQDLLQIYVIMDDGKISRASVTGFSLFSDVAVLKLLSGQDTEPPVIGDSGRVKIGEPVVAIGSPGDVNQQLGLKDTLTAGVVSQVNRYVDVEGNWVANMIQFDAPVNFGNSGGPLANSSGEIIGLVTARIDPTLGDGIYYAVASNKFKRVADAIIVGGSFPYPWVGVSIRDITPREAQEKSLETLNGAYVSDVAAGSPAQEAGVQAGDIIISEDDVTIKDVDELVSYLGEFKSPGQEMKLSILRGTEKLQITVTVGIRPD